MHCSSQRLAKIGRLRFAYAVTEDANRQTCKRTAKYKRMQAGHSPLCTRNLEVPNLVPHGAFLLFCTTVVTQLQSLNAHLLVAVQFQGQNRDLPEPLADPEEVAGGPITVSTRLSVQCLAYSVSKTHLLMLWICPWLPGS